MELAVKDLKLGEATTVMDYNAEDPYQMIQVHDYMNLSFLRLNPSIRAASKRTIEEFSTAYPELLREKFFINVPAIMGWMFTAMKLFLSKATVRKFHPITNGANLAREFPAFAEELPKRYGGKGPELTEGAQTVPLEEDATPEPEKETTAPEPAKEEAATEQPAKEETTAPAATPAETPAETTTADKPAETTTVDKPAETTTADKPAEATTTDKPAEAATATETPAVTSADTGAAAPAAEEAK